MEERSGEGQEGTQLAESQHQARIKIESFYNGEDFSETLTSRPEPNMLFLPIFFPAILKNVSYYSFTTCPLFFQYSIKSQSFGTPYIYIEDMYAVSTATSVLYFTV